MVRFLVPLVVGLLSVRTASAQSGPDKTVARLPAPLGCDRLTIAEGLPHSNVRALVQDKFGFMWVGTQDGLARYDGVKMRVYRPQESDPTSISSGYITALTVDATGKLWVSTAEHGINVYDPVTDRFTRFVAGTGKQALSSEGVTSSARDTKDRLWFAMSGGGLDRYEAASGTFVHVAKPLDVAITSIDVDDSGDLWLGTTSDGVMRWNPDTNAVTTYQPEDLGIGTTPVSAVFLASSGKLWIGTDGDGLLALDRATGKVTHHRTAADDPATITDDHVSVLYEDRDKNLWIGTPNGLNRMSADGKIVRFQHDPQDPTSLSFHGVDSLYEDAGGVMWVGGFTVGICKFDLFRQKLGYHRIRNNFSTSFFEDPDGTLWVGTYNDGLYKYQRNAQRVTIYHQLSHRQDGKPGSIPLETGTWISSLHRDKAGTLWMALKGRGLVGFDTKTETYREYVPDPEDSASLPVDSIFDIWEDAQGILWLASWGAGLVRFDPKSEVFTAYTADGDDAARLPSNHLYTVQPDPSDPKLLWIGTAKGGLVRFNMAAGNVTTFRHQADKADSLSSDDVVTIYPEPNGPIWLGTYGGGLDKLDPATGKVERFTTSNSALTNDGILGLVPDDDGNLWMSTNGGGLVELDPKTRKFTIYDSSDGLQDDEFNQGSYMRTKSGELFFGGPRGFNAFRPKDLVRDTYVPPIALTAFKIFNQEVKLPRPIWTRPEIEVSYTDSFEVQFAALAFAAPKKNRYAYKLEGFDDRFIETDRPYATYTKLDGGHYTLRVRAANRHGVWNEQAIALSIAVTPPIWRTWQAFGLYVLLIAGAVFMLFRTQRQRVLRAEREGRLAVVERDLALTGAVQSGFLPELNEIATERLQVFGLYRPADACGGDWWWHEPLPGGFHLIMVGDVTGHGPGPAMVTAAVATAFRVLAESGITEAEQVLELLNREVLRVAKGKYHMTMACLLLDENTGHWQLFNAGAPPIMTLDRAGKHRVHFCPGAPLGTETGFEVGRSQGQLRQGDRILIYTDGIPELNLPNGNVLGMRRFAQLYERTRGQYLREAAATIITHADQSRGNQPQLDDWTFTLIEWGDPAVRNDPVTTVAA